MRPTTLLILAALAMPVLLVGCGSSSDRSGFASKRITLDGVTAGTALPAAVHAELLVIERTPGLITDHPPSPRTDHGGLRARLPEQETEVPLPLEHTDVRARISGFVASVGVTQRYHNPYDQKIEAVYVFPLPDDAAVTDFLMTIGDRTIRGIIRERKEARRIYEEAKRQGRVASLLTQERPNIFTQSVANIEPGKRIDVAITYFNTLPFRDGEYVFAFPMVVGPRFIPGSPIDGGSGLGREPATDRVPDADRIAPPALKPNEISPHDISVRVEIDAGVPLTSIACRTHVVEVERPGPTRAVITLSPRDAIPNKDLVIRYGVAGDRSRVAYLTQPDEDGGSFALLLQPPRDLASLPRVAREMVFVLDCSGSMRGKPLAIAKGAIERCLKRLDENDSFQIIRFSENASSLGRAPIAATGRNVRRGLGFLRRLEGGGGTMMIEGVKAALDFPHDEKRLRIVSFWTDGYIGNEASILAAVEKRIGSARLFSFGIGSSVNRYLLEGMARFGRGSVAYVGLDDSAVDAVDAFYRRAGRPAMADIAIDFGGAEVVDVYPRIIPDLIVGRPQLITGRFRGAAPASVRVTGRAGPRDLALSARLGSGEESRHPALPKIWARRKIAHLSDLEVLQPSEELKGEITAVSIKNGVQCRYTSFLAVDSLSKTAGDHGVSVPVAVPVPEGVRYDTTITK